MDRKKTYRLMLGISLLFFLVNRQIAYTTPLTLRQAEKTALALSPEIKSLQAKSRALGQSAIAAGQLPDPKLIVGALNVPVDTFALSQEPMTQIQIKLQQSFPRGRSRYYRSLQKHDLSIAELHTQQAMQLKILQGVRLNWLNLYYWLRAKHIILKQKRIFRHWVKVTESMLANNKAQQKDVIRAQLELTALDSRLLEITQHIDRVRAGLGRWIGPSLARTVYPAHLPAWPVPPSMNQLQYSIKQHAVLNTDRAFISAGHASIKLAEQQYKPGFTVGIAYGFRQGHDFDGQSRADFLTAQVGMDLPLFPHNRQDRTLKASEDTLLASQENQISHYRQLYEVLKAQYATWEQQRKNAHLYRSKLIPEAKQYATATMTAYQNAQTDFPTLARAYIRELKVELAGLKVIVNRDTARVHLLYLQGQ